MKLILNILCYLVGLIWLAAGLSGIIDPTHTFTEGPYASLHVQVTGDLGTSDMRAFGGLLTALGLGILYATHNSSGKRSWFAAFAFLMLGLALGRTASLYMEGPDQTLIIFAAVEYSITLILFLKSRY